MMTPEQFDEFMDYVYETKLTKCVKLNEKMYLVDSIFTLDKGFETMIFDCDKYGRVTDWSGAYTEYHNSYEEMKSRFNYIIGNIQEVLHG